MQILTEIGEIGIHAPGREVVLRPSLYAMSRLTDPVGLLLQLFEGSPREQFDAALEVVQACSEEDLTDLTGHMGSRYGTWVMGKIPPRDLVTLARSLIRHGLVGVVPALPTRQEDAPAAYAPEFRAREFAALAMAHLGFSQAEAWGLTVTAFVLAMRAKFPAPKTGPGAPSAAELDAALERLNAINKAR